MLINIHKFIYVNTDICICTYTVRVCAICVFGYVIYLSIVYGVFTTTKSPNDAFLRMFSSWHITDISFCLCHSLMNSLPSNYFLPSVFLSHLLNAMFSPSQNFLVFVDWCTSDPRMATKVHYSPFLCSKRNHCVFLQRVGPLLTVPRCAQVISA